MRELAILIAIAHAVLWACAWGLAAVAAFLALLIIRRCLHCLAARRRADRERREWESFTAAHLIDGEITVTEDRR